MAKNWKCKECDTLIWNRFTYCKKHAYDGKRNPNYGKGIFGKDNHNWKGGIAKNPYTFKFKQLRPSIHLRYKICQLCSANKDLVVHHINHNKLDNSVNNMITLCRSCNSKEQFNIPYNQNYLGYKVLLKFLEVKESPYVKVI